MDSTRDGHIKRDRGPTLAHLWISGFIQKQEECMLQGGGDATYTKADHIH